MVEHALAYAERGFRIFPVHGKRPAIRKWPELASIDPVRIRKWWTKWPQANIGLAVARSGLVVLDVDPRNDGDKSFDRLVGLVGRIILDGPTVLSSRGGCHLYFERPADPEMVRALRASVGPGIDIPAFTVMPPSVHASGTIYRWEVGDEDAVPLPLPAAVLALFPSPTVTLRPSLVVGALGVGKRAFETSKPQTRPNISGGQKFAKNREMLERYARRFARPGATCEPPADDGGTRLVPWAVAWATTPGTWGENSTAIRDRLLAVARDYYRVHGDDGEPMFRAALAQKATISPDLRKPSPTTKDKRHALAWSPFGKRAWDRAVAEPTTDEAIDLDGMAERTPQCERAAFDRAAAAYAVLLLEARRLGVRAERFQKDYGAIAYALGVSRMSAHRYVREATDFGLIEIIDVGKARAKGQRGTPTLFFIATAKMVASVERVEPMVVQTSKRRSAKSLDREPFRLAG